jgi:hypothetical protein
VDLPALAGAVARLLRLLAVRAGPGRIVATEADYLAIRALVAELIADAVGATIAESVRETVETVKKLADDGTSRGGPPGSPSRRPWSWRSR